jgi:hypothetical protein
MIKLSYFGYDNPNLERVATPVGVVCLWCDETIRADDQGLIMRGVGLPEKFSRGLTPGWVAYHLECNLRSIFGSADCQTRGKHVRGSCIDVREGQTKREAAKEAVEVWERKHAPGRKEP